jgi:hypothetical protein
LNSTIYNLFHLLADVLYGELHAELVELCACLLPVESVEYGALVVLLECLHWRLIKPGGQVHGILQGTPATLG